MNPRRFRVRGYDVFPVQACADDLKASQPNSNTQPVTSLLPSSPPAALSLCFHFKHFSPLKPHFPQRHSGPPPFPSHVYPPVLSLSPLCPSSLSSHSALCIFPSILSWQFGLLVFNSAASAAQQG